MRKVRLGTGEEIINAKDFMSLGNEAVAKVRTQKASTAGNENSFQFSLPFLGPIFMSGLERISNAADPGKI
jgi:hypothetical protein